MKRLRKSILLAGLLCSMPAVALLPGCGGGGGGGVTVATNQFAGTYNGRYSVTQGPQAGQSGTFRVSISNDNSASGSFTVGGFTITFSGTVDPNTGAFSGSGQLPNGITGSATGAFVKNGTTVTGNGTFQISNGDRGTFTIP
jgi:hypothetical protein